MPRQTARMTINQTGIARIRGEAEEVTRRVTHAVADDVDRFVPVDTGALKASKRVRIDGLIGRVFIGTDYWMFVEYGTRYMAAEPYMRPALYRNRPLGAL